MQSVNFDMLKIILEEIKHRNLNGCLNITNDNQSTLIYFNQGNIYYSLSANKGIEGEFALFQLLGWKSGQLSWDTNPEYPQYNSVDFEQASNFYDSLESMQRRGILLKPGSQPLDLKFFSIMKHEPSPEVDSHFWHQIIEANYCPYRDLPANTADFKGLLRTFETSKRTGIIQVNYLGFEEYYLVEKGQLIGSFHYDESKKSFKPLAKTDFSLFNQMGSRMGVFLVPTQTQTSAPKATIAPTPKSKSATFEVPDRNLVSLADNSTLNQASEEKTSAKLVTSLDDNNPFDF